MKASNSNLQKTSRVLTPHVCSAYRGLWLFDRSQHDDKISRFTVSKAIAEAKLIAPVVAFEAINDALQWFGAFGYTLDCPLEMGLARSSIIYARRRIHRSHENNTGTRTSRERSSLLQVNSPVMRNSTR